MNNKVDLSYLEEVTGGSTEIIKEMLELFLSETPTQIQLLKEKCQLSAWNEVRAEAHKLKPTFLYIGLEDSNAKLATIESNARSNENLDNISLLISSVENEFNEVQSEVQELIQKLSS